MKKWLADVKLTVYDNYNNEYKNMTVQVLVKAPTYGDASMAADRYVLTELRYGGTSIGPIKEIID